MVWLYDLGSTVLGAAVANPLLAVLAIAAAFVALAAIARRLGWLDRARRHPRGTAAILVPLLAVALPVGWYLTSPLILSASIDEPPPVVATAGPSQAPPAPGRPPVRRAVDSPVRGAHHDSTTRRLHRRRLRRSWPEPDPSTAAMTSTSVAAPPA